MLSVYSFRVGNCFRELIKKVQLDPTSHFVHEGIYSSMRCWFFINRCKASKKNFNMCYSERVSKVSLKNTCDFFYRVLLAEKANFYSVELFFICRVIISTIECSYLNRILSYYLKK